VQELFSEGRLFPEAERAGACFYVLLVGRESMDDALAGEATRQAEQLNELGRSLNVGFQATGLGGVMNTQWSSGPITEPSAVLPVSATPRRLFQLEMIERGYYVSQRGMINLSLPMQQSDVDGFVAAVRDYLTRYAAHLRV